jgi:hypothetical protein
VGFERALLGRRQLAIDVFRQPIVPLVMHRHDPAPSPQVPPQHHPRAMELRLRRAAGDAEQLGDLACL